MRTCFRSLILLWASLCALSFSADAPLEPPSIPGYLMIHSGDDVPPALAEALVKISGGPAAKVAYVTTATNATEIAETKLVLETFQKCGAEHVQVLSADHRDDATSAATLKDATCVWLNDPAPSKAKQVFGGTHIETELRALLKRGGALAGSSVWLEEFLPYSMLELHPGKVAAHDELLKRVAKKSGFVGYCVDDDATLMVHHRGMFVYGGNVSVCIPASASRPARDEILTAGSQADLVALVRSARERLRPTFPPVKCEPSDLEGGTLVIDGGGIPKDALLRFIQAAGGPDALILVVPTAQGDDVPLFPGEGKMLRAAGAKNVKTFHLATYADAFDEAKIKILNDAKGIWFCGGRQWRYVDAYLDTPAEKLMHAVLKRGGAIGGSSAGATIQGDYLVRGNPLGNQQMMAEGYERGLGFLKGVAIDQHFTKRHRFADMALLKKTFPQLLGLGIDEGAAVVVTGHVMEVIGIGPACVYDKNETPMNGDPDHVTLKPGDKYDLKTRSKL